MSIKYHSYTLDKQNDEMMNVSLPRYKQRMLQTLAALYIVLVIFSAKVCSYQSVGTDELLNILVRYIHLLTLLFI